MDKSNGYESIAAIFIKGRGQAVHGIGAPSVRNWAKTLPAHAMVLDLGCGTGIPISKVMLDAGMTLYAIDASPRMVQTFQQNFPNTPVTCEAVADSLFFNRTFDAIVAWGLLFLLPENVQEMVLQKAAHALQAGGKRLFTTPSQKIAWKDAMTGQHSTSLGAETYKHLLSKSGLSLIQ